MSAQSPKNIFRRTLWFERKLTFETGFFDVLQPQRDVRTQGRYKSGVYYSEKCSRYIQYESKLELQFITDQLEKNPSVVFYWEQPVRIPYWRGKVKAKYIPDFGVFLKSGHFVIVEVKSMEEMLTHRVQAKTEGLMDFCSRRGFGLLLTDGKHTPADLLKGTVNRKLEKEISLIITTRPIRESEYKEIKTRSNATPSQFYRAIIRLDLKFATRSFKLQRGNQSPVFRQVYFEKKKFDELTGLFSGI